MSRVLNDATTINWRPTTTRKALQLRAKLLADIRQFFSERQILEVETPLLSQHTVTDLHIESFAVPTSTQNYYLQTSPEYAMKRLLAADSGSIFQICKAFRKGDSGTQHNPEFTMLEWYRLGFDHHQLMQEVDDFLKHCIQSVPAEKKTYREIFIDLLKIDPNQITLKELQAQAKTFGYESQINDTIDDLLMFLFSHSIEPHIGFKAPMIVYDFPAGQAALAKIRNDHPPVAERFEVYLNGMELANGFHELTNASEQRQRFLQDQTKREKQNFHSIEIDQRFITALESGLPNCAGVALGIDRLLMAKAQTKNIQDIINFPWSIA